MFRRHPRTEDIIRICHISAPCAAQIYMYCTGRYKPIHPCSSSTGSSSQCTAYRDHQEKTAPISAHGGGHWSTAELGGHFPHCPLRASEMAAVMPAPMRKLTCSQPGMRNRSSAAAVALSSIKVMPYRGGAGCLIAPSALIC